MRQISAEIHIKSAESMTFLLMTLIFCMLSSALKPKQTPHGGLHAITEHAKLQRLSTALYGYLMHISSVTAVENVRDMQDLHI